jgi:peptidyl-prolyl cis-trans isomerase SurA
LGYVPESALEKVSPELRKVVMSLPAGATSQIVHTQEGYRIFKVLSRESPGQRELNDPRVQTSIRDTLRNSKDQLLRGAYYEVARNGAKVENFLARKVIENAGKK